MKISNNYNLVYDFLKTKHNDGVKLDDWKYLSIKQIEGIIDYLIDNYDDEDINISEFIDNQLINGLGFDENGQPKDEE